MKEVRPDEKKKTTQRFIKYLPFGLQLKQWTYHLLALCLSLFFEHDYCVIKISSWNQISYVITLSPQTIDSIWTSLLEPFEALFHRPLHFPFNTIHIITSHSLFPLNLCLTQTLVPFLRLTSSSLRFTVGTVSVSHRRWILVWTISWCAVRSHHHWWQLVCWTWCCFSITS